MTTPDFIRFLIVATVLFAGLRLLRKSRGNTPRETPAHLKAMRAQKQIQYTVERNLN